MMKDFRYNRETPMRKYVDGFVLPIPKRNIQAYRRLARLAGKVWRELGALEYRECIGEDFNALGSVPFPRAIRLKRGETVFFSWIVYKSRADRDRIVANVMKDPRLEKMADPKSMPFASRRPESPA